MLKCAIFKELWETSGLSDMFDHYLSAMAENKLEFFSFSGCTADGVHIKITTTEGTEQGNFKLVFTEPRH